MQNIFVSVINRIYGVSRNMDKKLRTLILFFCCLIIMSMHMFSFIGLRLIIRETIGCIITAIMIIVSIDEVQTPVRWNKAVIYPSVLFGAGILVINLIHTVGEGFVIYAIDLMIVFPALYFVWANRGDHEVLYDLLSAAILVEGLFSFVYFFILSLNGQLWMPGGRVAWFGYSPNYMGMWGVLMVLAGLYLARRYSAKMAVVVTAAAGIGAGMAFCILPVSRTAMLAEIVTVLLYIIFRVKAHRSAKEELKGSGKRIIIMALIICGVLVAGLRMDNLNERAAIKSSADGSAQQTAQEASDVTGRLSGGEDLNSYSSGRIGIWEIYIRNFSLLGKDWRSIKKELKNEPSPFAHNNIIDYYFRCGYIVGTFYLIYYITQGLCALKILFSRENRSAVGFFVVAITGIYSLYAMLEMSILPFIRCITCVYFLTISPLMTKTDREETSAEVLDQTKI